MTYKINIFNTINLKLEITRVRNDNAIYVFNYHQISNKFQKEYHSKGTFTDINFFEEQIIWLNQNFKIISLSQAIEMVKYNKIDDQYACITFDDGDKSILKTMEILEKYNIKATFFINSGYLDNRSAGWFHIYQYIKNTPKYHYLLTEDIETNIKFLRGTGDKILYNKYYTIIEALFDNIQREFNMFVSYDDLKNINNELFDIGLHGYQHQRFSMMNYEWQKSNILRDIDNLSTLKAYKPIFAIPFGRPHDWNIDTIKICIDLDLEFVFADGGVNSSYNIGLKRIPADGRELKKLI